MQISLARLRTFARRSARDDKGAVAVEWAAIAGASLVIAVTVFLGIGEQVNVILSEVQGQLQTIIDGTPAGEA